MNFNLESVIAWATKYSIDILATLDAAGISIPFPQQDVHLLVEKGLPEAAARG